MLGLLLSSAHTASLSCLSSFCVPTLPQFQRPGDWGWTRVWEGTQPEQLIQTDQSNAPCRTTCSAIKAESKDEESRHLLLTFVLQSNSYTYWGSTSHEITTVPADGKMRISLFFFFPLLSCTALPFLYQIAFILTCEFFFILFSSPLSCWGGSNRVGWWACDSHWRTSHHKNTLHVL